MNQADIVGLWEIAARLGTTSMVVSKWRERSRPGHPYPLNPIFPEPRWVLRCGPVWDWKADVLPWVQARAKAKGTRALPT